MFILSPFLKSCLALSLLESCTPTLRRAFARSHLLGQSGGGGNPVSGTDVSHPDRILRFFMETAKRASRPALLWLLGKAAQVCLRLVLTRFSLGDGVSPPTKLGVAVGPMSLEEGADLCASQTSLSQD